MCLNLISICLKVLEQNLYSPLYKKSEKPTNLWISKLLLFKSTLIGCTEASCFFGKNGINLASSD